MKLQYKEEDRREIEAHFAERVQAYVELGETPEQARLSATEKFGETEVVVRRLRRRSFFRPSLGWNLAFAGFYLVATAICKAAHVHDLAWGIPVYTLGYALYLIGSRRYKVCR